jgi:penicillin amidase
VIKFLLITFLNIFFIKILNSEIFSIPPLGKILNPFSGIFYNSKLTEESLVNKTIYLKNKIKIFFDKNLVPHIYAENLEDLYYAQGYVTAMLRLWQIDTNSRIVSGTLSEVFGEKALIHDREMVRRGMRSIISKSLENSKKNPSFYKLLESYINGINEYVSNLPSKKYPIEYKLMNYSPKSFTTYDIAATSMMIVYDMGGYSNSIESTLDYFNLGKDIYEKIFMDNKDKEDNLAVIRKNFSTNKNKIENSNSPSISCEFFFENTLLKKDLNSNPNEKGSNSWIILPSKTKNKEVILANDPHLELTLPSIFFLVYLESKDDKIMGFSVPGIPGIIIGKNQNISWGITNGSICTTSWYKVKLNDKDTHFFIDGSWKEVSKKKEVIKIKNKKNFIEEIIYTDHGPVVYDKSFTNKNGLFNLASRWILNVDNQNVDNLYAMHLINHSKNFEDFQKAVCILSSPVLNFSFASKNFSAINVIGRIPKVIKGNNKFVMDGTDSSYIWKESVDLSFDLLDQSSSLGFLFSANQRLSNSTFPHYYSHYKNHPYRNERIHEILDQNENYDEEKVKKDQNDNYNLAARYSIDLIKKIVKKEDIEEKNLELFELLISWNLKNDSNEIGPSIFKEWQNQVNKILWEEFYPIIVKPSFKETLYIIENEKIDFKKYKNKDEFIKKTINLALEKISDWEKKNKKKALWCLYRDMYINHLTKISGFSKKNLSVGGGKDIINANEKNCGASLRFINVIKDEKSKFYFVYPGGQSGNPASYFYDNLISSWEKGEYIKYDF